MLSFKLVKSIRGVAVNSSEHSKLLTGKIFVIFFPKHSSRLFYCLESKKVEMTNIKMFCPPHSSPNTEEGGRGRAVVRPGMEE